MFAFCFIASKPFFPEKIKYLNLKIQGQDHKQNWPKSDQEISRPRPLTKSKMKMDEKLLRIYWLNKSQRPAEAWIKKKNSSYLWTDFISYMKQHQLIHIYNVLLYRCWKHVHPGPCKVCSQGNSWFFLDLKEHNCTYLHENVSVTNYNKTLQLGWNRIIQMWTLEFPDKMELILHNLQI